MIAEATVRDLPLTVAAESAVRIASLYHVYGTETRFLRFFADGEGRAASVMDGTCCLYAPDGINEEWEQFLQMEPSVSVVRCEGSVGRMLSEHLHIPCKTGKWLSYVGGDPGEQDVGHQLHAEELYALLSKHFSDMPPFAGWYVDISHRVRHGYCELAVIERDGRPVSTAMTVAQTPSCALLGSVATDPAWRKQGLAGKCLRSLIHRSVGKTVMIAALTDYAAELYQKYGFVVSGEWAQVEKTKG